MNETTSIAPASRAWFVLFTCLCLSAGHGIALYFVVSRVNLIPTVHDMGDGEAALLVAWFLLTVPLAALALLLRKRLARMSPGLLRLVASGAVLVTVLAFARYAMVVARG